ncbi:MAG: IS66 family insertion sequence element accessory protein TnpB [Oscillospiraceae bacterium]|nr:IS66 family insertion sequence element accessory protein TnpB [Oscillospiraceae bacterium]
MFDYSRVQNYYIACGYTDMRRQIDGLVALVELQYKQKVNETSLYLFCGNKSDRIKALYWDGTGYVLLYKRLAEKRFQWPRNKEELKLLTAQEFRWLMEGLSIIQTKAFENGKPGSVF